MNTNKRKTPANAQKQAQEPVKDIPGIPEGEPGETAARFISGKLLTSLDVYETISREHPRVLTPWGNDGDVLRAILDELVLIRLHLQLGGKDGR